MPTTTTDGLETSTTMHSGANTNQAFAIFKAPANPPSVLVYLCRMTACPLPEGVINAAFQRVMVSTSRCTAVLTSTGFSECRSTKAL